MKKRRIFWIVSLMLLFATALSFMDRQVLSISIIQIKDDLHITDTEYGFINSGFLISYAVMFTLGGVLIDKYGSRLGLAFSVGFWSLATALHALSTNAFHFGLFRFLLGIGEGGCFPGAIKAVIEWVPKQKHAIANGIAIGGSAIGAVVAVPLCAFTLNYTNWRVLFLISGILGLIWVLFWLRITSRHANDRNIKPKAASPSLKTSDFIELLKNRDALLFILIRFLLDPIFYFYMFWIPKYLNESKGLSLDLIGNILWIPFLALGIANVIGGWLSDKIQQRTGNTNRARKISMGLAATLTFPVLLVGILDSSTLIIIVMSLAFFAHGIWITNYITSIGDVFGINKSSTVVGLSGTAGAISSFIVNPLMGLVIANYTYTPLWVYSGIMYPVAFLIFLFFLHGLRTNVGK
ncbi:MFS transporter [uncultured Parabacteroides sp.]|uniref:MFS transporter n=1 Tax=uncultured Parabacteroides sp. TaxID=512312 RepID=UPI0025EE3A77|nr:MFS transporter [uncultured Parabacteroides sp.]